MFFVQVKPFINFGWKLMIIEGLRTPKNLEWPFGPCWLNSAKSKMEIPSLNKSKTAIVLVLLGLEALFALLPYQKVSSYSCETRRELLHACLLSKIVFQGYLVLNYLIVFRVLSWMITVPSSYVHCVSSVSWHVSSSMLGVNRWPFSWCVFKL